MANNSKADAGFKKWFADLGIYGVMSFRYELFESKVDSWQNNTRQRDWYDSDPDDRSKAYIDDKIRRQYWNDAVNEAIPILKSGWAAQQSGSTSGTSFIHFRNLTVSNRQEGWEAIKSAGIKIGLEWATHFLGGGLKNLNTTSKLLTRSQSHIGYGKAFALRQFADGHGATSFHNFKEIPGYAIRKFQNFEQAFNFVAKHTVRTRGKISFNLNGVDIAFAKI